MFDTFGGIPRTLFQRRSVMDAFKSIAKCLSETPSEVLKQAFISGTFAQLPKALPGLLVHIKEDPPLSGYCVAEIASSTILYHLLEFSFRSELISFLNATSPKRMVEQIRGELVELYMHEAFGSGSVQVDFK